MVDRLKIKMSEERHQLRKEVAALKAENERLAKALSEQIDRDISGLFPAERALAERAGGVKVKALEWDRSSVDGLIEYADSLLGEYQVWAIGDTGYFYRQSFATGQPAGENIEAAKAAAQADYERRILSALTTEPAAPEDYHPSEDELQRAADAKGLSYSAAPEGRQEAGRIGDAVLDWMVKFDLLDAGNEYYVSDVLAVLNDLRPSTHPSEQAVAWQHIPGCGTDRESKMVSVSEGAFCDPCIAPLVAALNTAGIETVASCCGHGHRPGVIALRDGRELFIAKDFDEARKIESIFPVDINGNTRPSERAVTDEMVEAACLAWINAPSPLEDSMRAALKAAMEAGRHD